MRNFIRLILFFILPALTQTGCSRQPALNNLRVNVIGLDGATWEIIDPLIERGELPGFARMKKEGVWGNLETFQPTDSVSIWTSIATGVTPTRHGIQTFIRSIPGSDRTIPSPGTDRRVPALWNIVSDAGRTVVCVKWFATWPAEEVNGAMLSPRLEDDAGGHQTYPPELYREISGFRHKSTMDRLPQPVKSDLPVRDFSAPGVLIGTGRIKNKMFDDTSVWEAGYHVYRKYDPDLFMIYLKSIDRVEHFLWGAQEVLNDPDPDENDLQNAKAIFGWYRYFDSKILELTNDPDRILIVVSDHGMQARDSIPEPYDVRNIDFNRVLTDLGYQIQSGPKQTAWNKTVAYAFRPEPYDWACQINLNLSGREPEGLIAPEDSPARLQELMELLKGLKTESGRNVFEKVDRGSSGYDLRVELNRTLSLDDRAMVLSTAIPLRQWINVRGLPLGIHTKAPDGIIAAIGPSLKSGYRLTGASVLDITPTVLFAMGLPLARDFDGSCLVDAFTESFRSNHPVRWIETHGTRQIDSVLKETGADDRIKDELRALGYI
ncbi:alkaline phosphatase family protein [bacterium]|nr:alkaline phosphatase family protein [candidate division CSSED10-310 bacterium]